MEISLSNKKASLFRKLREQDYSHQIYNFDDFTKHYDETKLKYYDEILKEYEGKKYSDYVTVPKENLHLYSEKYLESPLYYKNANGYNLHFEFDFVLHYQLFNIHKKGLGKFLSIISDTFPLYYVESENSYHIPYGAYQKFFKDLEDKEIIEAIEFLVKTNTFAINTNPETVITSIDISLINERLLTAKNYK